MFSSFFINSSPYFYFHFCSVFTFNSPVRALKIAPTTTISTPPSPHKYGALRALGGSAPRPPLPFGDVSPTRGGRGEFLPPTPSYTAYGLEYGLRPTLRAPSGPARLRLGSFGTMMGPLWRSHQARRARTRAVGP